MDLAVYETDVPSVLVADEATDGSEIARLLEDAASVQAVDSKADALEVLDDATAEDDASVDCLLTASDLADASGLELTRTARERHADLPIVFAPASGSAEGARAATTAGATYYVPLDLAADGELADLVLEAVEAYDEDRQVERERNMFQELLSNTPLAVYFKDREGRHVCVSSEASAYRSESLIGKTDLDLYADDIGEETARESYEDDLHVIETEEPIVNKEERHVTDEGEVTWMRTTKVPWRDEDGEVIGLIGISRSITEVKQRELELEQEKRRLEQFASFVSHDLRNPVNVAKGYLQEGIDTREIEPLEEVATSLDRMDQMIDDLLHMARPDEEQDMEEWTPVREVAEETWDSILEGAPPAVEDGARLDVRVPEDSRLMGTRGALRQILENVYKNSINYAGTDVTVGVGLTETGFYVEDDGPGIPADERDRVFDYGYTTEGTGVGLAIVKEIADAHRWQVDVTESSAGGARFEFHGCIRKPPACVERPPAEPVELSEQSNVDDATPVGHAQRDGAGAWTVCGGGANVWAEVDEYYAVHEPVAGDLRLEARLVDLESIHEYSKAGAFIAEAVEAGSPIGFAGLTASHGTETFWRTERGSGIGSRQHAHTSVSPLWFRLDRIGDRVTCYTSRNGTDWDVLDQNVVDLSETVHVGLLVSSHNEKRLCEATFDDVRVVELHAAEE